MKEKILVIDDEEIIRKFIQRALTREDYLVETIGDSRTALEVVSREIFDVILVDLKMPEINGMTIVKKIKESNYKTGIIIISGVISYEAEKETSKLGIENYLIKPFTIDKLLNTVKKCLENR
jgi:DNA-binding NtrC family response regulator